MPTNAWRDSALTWLAVMWGLGLANAVAGFILAGKAFATDPTFVDGGGGLNVGMGILGAIAGLALALPWIGAFSLAYSILRQPAT